MICPRCTNCELKQGRTKTGDVEIDYCPRCKGIWMDQREIELLSDNAIKDLSIPPAADLGQLACPCCGCKMHEFDYPQTLTVIDMCSECEGIWLDSGELKEIEIVRSNIPKKSAPPVKHHNAKKKSKPVQTQYFNHKWSDRIEKMIALIAITSFATAFIYLQYSSERDCRREVSSAKERIQNEVRQIPGYEEHSASINRLIDSNHETAKNRATHRSSSTGPGKHRTHTKSFMSFQYDTEILKLMLAQARSEDNKPAISILAACQENREKEFRSKRSWYMNELDP